MSNPRNCLAKCILSLCLLLVSAISFDCTAQNLTQKRYAWKGLMGKNIPVSVWIQMRSDGITVGQLTYTKTGSGRPIMLLGNMTQPDDRQIYLNEADSEGFYSGTITGRIKDDGTFSGYWTTNKELKNGTVKEVKYPLVLDTPTPFPENHPDYLRHATKDEIGGEYAFSYMSEDDGLCGGNLYVYRNGSMVDFSVIVVGPNIADVSSIEDGTKVRLSDNKFNYKVNCCDYRFECEFFPKFAYIHGFNSDFGCFGNNTSIEGFFVRNALYIDKARPEELAKANFNNSYKITADESKYAVDAIIKASTTVKDVKIVSLTIDEMTKEGNIYFKAETISYIPVLTPQKPIFLKFANPGDNPIYGITYKNENGVQRTKGIIISNKDGKIMLQDVKLR